MQEIEFRGKRIADNKWVYGFYHNVYTLKSPASDRMVTQHHIYTQDFDVIVNGDTVEQYTGRKDKNGKKIFGGDIVTYINTQDFVYEVGRKMCGWIEYDEDNCCWFCKNSFQHHTMWVYGDDIEVIGNIWDNPELLEVNNDN